MLTALLAFMAAVIVVVGLFTPFFVENLLAPGFDAANDRGDNLFTRDAYLPARVLWPFHRRYRDDGPATYRAFDFHTSVGPSRQDAALDVLRLDYNLPANPRLFVTIRRVLDEVVQVADGYYLGKAYVRWYWGCLLYTSPDDSRLLSQHADSGRCL